MFLVFATCRSLNAMPVNQLPNEDSCACSARAHLSFSIPLLCFSGLTVDQSLSFENMVVAVSSFFKKDFYRHAWKLPQAMDNRKEIR